MKKIYLNPAVLMLAIGLLHGFTGCNSKFESANLLVLNSENSYLVLDEYSGKEIERYEDGAEAIQYAIDRIPAIGGKVTIGAGVFLIDRTIRLKSHIHFSGSGPGTKLVFQNRQEASCLLADSLDRVIVSDLAVVAGDSLAGTGIELNHCGDCLVKDVHVSGFNKYGVLLANRSF